MRKLIIIIIAFCLITPLNSFSCSCKFSQKEYKKLIHHSFKNSKNIFLAKAINPNTEIKKDSSVFVSGVTLSTHKIWRGSIQNGSKLGRFPDDEGIILTNSCDKQLLSNTTYIFLQNDNTINLCQIAHWIKKEEIELVSNLTLKQLKKYLIKSMRTRWKSIKKNSRVFV